MGKKEVEFKGRCMIGTRLITILKRELKCLQQI
jgi:hypothetical protein